MDNIDDTKLAELKHTLNDPLESDNDSVIETSEIYDDGEFEEGELDHDDDDDDDDEKDETEDVENVTNQSNDLDNDIEDKLKEDMDEYMDVNMGMNVEDDDESEINSTNNDLENENESSDDDYDDDDDDEDELYLFDDEYKNDQINNNHTLLKVNNMHEIKALCMILRDINNKIVDDHHKTIPLLTKYEKANEDAKVLRKKLEVFGDATFDDDILALEDVAKDVRRSLRAKRKEKREKIE